MVSCRKHTKNISSNRGKYGDMVLFEWESFAYGNFMTNRPIWMPKTRYWSFVVWPSCLNAKGFLFRICAGDQESKQTNKGPLTGVKSKQRKAHTRAVLPVFSKSRESISLQNPALLLVLLLFRLFPIFWTFLKAARGKVSLSSVITLPSSRSSVKRHWN